MKKDLSREISESLLSQVHIMRDEELLCVFIVYTLCWCMFGMCCLELNTHICWPLTWADLCEQLEAAGQDKLCAEIIM